MLFGDGKHLRPKLYAFGLTCGLSHLKTVTPLLPRLKPYIPIHLIHDDLPAMDDDDFGFCKPSAHRQFDEASAILVYDLFLVLFMVSTISQYPELVSAFYCKVPALLSPANSFGTYAYQTLSNIRLRPKLGCYLNCVVHCLHS